MNLSLFFIVLLMSFDFLIISNGQETLDNPSNSMGNDKGNLIDDNVEHLEDKKHQERGVGVSYAHSQSSSGGSITRVSSVNNYGHHYYQQQQQQQHQRRDCDVVLWQGEGNLTSYNYPFNYPNGVQCSYRIPRVDFSSCALELIFHDFDLATDGSRCSSDFLQIGSKRFCGRLSQGTKEIVSFPYRESDVTFVFTSDDVESGRGFWMEVRRVYRSCNEVANYRVPYDLNVNAVRGRITSYSYPDDYRENLNCTYFIERQPGFCSVQLEFVDFDVGDSVGCHRDYMTVEGIRYCGDTLHGRKIDIDYHGRSEISLVFVADDDGGNRGFDIRYFQVECPREESTGRQVYSTPAPRPSCHREFTSREIYLQSPHYPSFYDVNMNCVYTIRRSSNDVCELEFLFVIFDLEYDRLCRGDYLEVNGGKICGPLPTGSSRRVRFYGSEMILRFHSDSTVNRPGFEIKITQKTDCSSGAQTQIMSSQSYCDEELCSQEFYLQSANYPNYYSNYLDCAYAIRKFSNEVCDLQLTFLSFDLQNDHSCRYDYLEIDGEKICGNIPHGNVRRVAFNKPEILVRFHSDRASSGRGFQIFAQQRRDCARKYIIPVLPPSPPPPPYCDETFTSNEFRLTSLHYPSNYEDNMSCTLRILRTSSRICELELIFNAFDLEEDAGCRYDYLEVGGQRHCGRIAYATVRKIKFTVPELILRFRSDHTTTRSGFDLTVRQVENCREEIVIQPKRIVPIQTTYTKGGSVFVQEIASYNTKGLAPPPPPIPIPRTIYTKGGTIVAPPPSPPTVMKGTIPIQRTVYTKETPVLAPIYTKGMQTIPLPSEPVQYMKGTSELLRTTIHTKGGVIVPQPIRAPVVVESTYSKGSSRQRVATNEYTKGTSNIVPQADYNTGRMIPSPHFMYDINGPSNGCDQVFTTWEFFFQSVNFPMNYGDGVDCVYRAQRFSLSVCEIELHFMSFDVDGGDQCQKDFLEVDGERFCGAIAPGTVRRYKFDSPEFVLHFHSDHESSGLGFNILVRQITDCPATPTQQPIIVRSTLDTNDNQQINLVQMPRIVPLYDFELSQPSSQFASLNYPGNYGDNLNCTYRIARTKDVCAVELYFYDFNIQSSPDCVNDYLLFGGRRYCGTELQGQTRIIYFEHSNEAVMKFVSDGDVSKKGWWTFYRQVPCTEVPEAKVTSELCGQTFAEETGFIKSRNYPLGHYPSDEDCFYRIKRVRDEICALELSFTDFTLEPSTDCANDYLEMDRRRYCGNDLLHKTVYLNFPVGSDDILLHFKSNDNHENTGFFVQVRQLSYGCRRTSNLLSMPQQYSIESNSCSRILRSESGMIESPGYSSNTYPENADCSYVIEKSNKTVCGLVLDFHHFSVETSRLCLYDYLQTSMGDRLCGNSWTGVQRTVPFPAHEDRLTFVFHSDDRIQDRGFNIEYRQITSECP